MFTAEKLERLRKKYEHAKGSDVFDPAFAAHVKKKAQPCRAQRDNPWLIGWFLDNELAWGRDWRNAPNFFIRYGRLPATALGKRAWCRFLRAAIP